MPVDVALTTSRDIRIDSTGDLATVAGPENTRVQHVNALFRAADELDAQLLDVDAAEDLRLAIQHELNALDDISSYSIQVEADPPRTLTASIDSYSLTTPVTREVTQ